MINYLKEVKITLEKKNEGPEVFKVTSPETAFNALKQIIGDSIDVYETVIVVFFNINSESIGWMKVSQGGINQSVVDLRLIFSAALQCLATGIIMCHNHPSGNLVPSSDDIKITKRIEEAGNIFSIKLFDHIIISDKSYYSFKNEGIL